jgi:hypothetical protein
MADGATPRNTTATHAPAPTCGAARGDRTPAVRVVLDELTAAAARADVSG